MEREIEKILKEELEKRIALRQHYSEIDILKFMYYRGEESSFNFALTTIKENLSKEEVLKILKEQNEKIRSNKETAPQGKNYREGRFETLKQIIKMVKKNKYWR